ncbi:hypothetical protein BGX34_004876 [Mortierella sp. NVP85]|nr:hypothetical protein BGX34_004876 [Mortierella sp. NVP85]
MSRGGGRGGGGRGRGAGAVIPMFGPDAVQATFKNLPLPVARHSADDEKTMYSAIKRLKDSFYASPYYLTEPKAPSCKLLFGTQIGIIRIRRPCDQIAVYQIKYVI